MSIFGWMMKGEILGSNYEFLRVNTVIFLYTNKVRGLCGDHLLREFFVLFCWIKIMLVRSEMVLSDQ